MQRFRTPQKVAVGFALLLPFLLFSALPAEEESRVELHGFFLGNYAVRTTGFRPGAPGAAAPANSDYPLAEERLRIDLSAADDAIDAGVRFKLDLFHDDLTGAVELDLREGFLSYTWEAFDFRLGRQVVTWGVGDLVFINDVFPKDWISFFTGRPLEYLKTGIDGLRVRYSSDRINFEALAIPVFQPDQVPTADRFFYYDPFAAVTNRVERRPVAQVDHAELALRAYGQIAEFDVSLYGYRGYWRGPSGIPDSFIAPTLITLVYPPLSVAGASLQGNAFGGVIALEGGYYDSRQDRPGRNPLIPNSQLRFLGGYQRQLWEDGTLGVQYYLEIMQDYTAYKQSWPAGLPRQRNLRDVVTLRFEQFFAHQTWRLSVMGFYSPADADFLLQPALSYKFSDRLSGAIGANIFGGRDRWTMFGQFNKNDNVYGSVRFDLW